MKKYGMKRVLATVLVFAMLFSSVSFSSFAAELNEPSPEILNEEIPNEETPDEETPDKETPDEVGPDSDNTSGEDSEESEESESESEAEEDLTDSELVKDAFFEGELETQSVHSDLVIDVKELGKNYNYGEPNATRKYKYFRLNTDGPGFYVMNDQAKNFYIQGITDESTGEEVGYYINKSYTNDPERDFYIPSSGTFLIKVAYWSSDCQKDLSFIKTPAGTKITRTDGVVLDIDEKTSSQAGSLRFTYVSPFTGEYYLDNSAGLFNASCFFMTKNGFVDVRNGGYVVYLTKGEEIRICTANYSAVKSKYKFKLSALKNIPSGVATYSNNTFDYKYETIDFRAVAAIQENKIRVSEYNQRTNSVANVLIQREYAGDTAHTRTESKLLAANVELDISEASTLGAARIRYIIPQASGPFASSWYEVTTNGKTSNVKLAAKKIGYNTADINVMVSEGEAPYRLIYRKENGTWKDVPKYVRSTSQTTYSVGDLEQNTKYQVCARDAAGKDLDSLTFTTRKAVGTASAGSVKNLTSSQATVTVTMENMPTMLETSALVVENGRKRIVPCSVKYISSQDSKKTSDFTMNRLLASTKYENVYLLLYENGVSTEALMDEPEKYSLAALKLNTFTTKSSTTTLDAKVEKKDDTRSNVNIRIITNKSGLEVKAQYREAGTDHFYEISGISSTGADNTTVANISYLTPDTTYEVRIFCDGKMKELTFATVYDSKEDTNDYTDLKVTYNGFSLKPKVDDASASYKFQTHLKNPATGAWMYWDKNSINLSNGISFTSNKVVAGAKNEWKIVLYKNNNYYKTMYVTTDNPNVSEKITVKTNSVTSNKVSLTIGITNYAHKYYKFTTKCEQVSGNSLPSAYETFVFAKGEGGKMVEYKGLNPGVSQFVYGTIAYSDDGEKYTDIYTNYGFGSYLTDAAVAPTSIEFKENNLILNLNEYTKSQDMTSSSYYGTYNITPEITGGDLQAIDYYTSDSSVATVSLDAQYRASLRMKKPGLVTITAVARGKGQTAAKATFKASIINYKVMNVEKNNDHCNLTEINPKAPNGSIVVADLDKVNPDDDNNANAIVKTAKITSSDNSKLKITSKNDGSGIYTAETLRGGTSVISAKINVKDASGKTVSYNLNRELSLYIEPTGLAFRAPLFVGEDGTVEEAETVSIDGKKYYVLDKASRRSYYSILYYTPKWSGGDEEYNNAIKKWEEKYTVSSEDNRIVSSYINTSDNSITIIPNKDGKTTIRAFDASKTIVASINVVVGDVPKELPDIYSWLEITDKLSDIRLPEGYTWVDSTGIIKEGANTFKVKFEDKSGAFPTTTQNVIVTGRKFNVGKMYLDPATKSGDYYVYDMSEARKHNIYACYELETKYQSGYTDRSIFTTNEKVTLTKSGPEKYLVSADESVEDGERINFVDRVILINPAYKSDKTVNISGGTRREIYLGTMSAFVKNSSPEDDNPGTEKEDPDDKPVEDQPGENPEDKPVEEPEEKPVEDQPVEEPEDKPVEDQPVEEPEEKPVEEPVFDHITIVDTSGETQIVDNVIRTDYVNNEQKSGKTKRVITLSVSAYDTANKTVDAVKYKVTSTNPEFAAVTQVAKNGTFRITIPKAAYGGCNIKVLGTSGDIKVLTTIKVQMLDHVPVIEKVYKNTIENGYVNPLDAVLVGAPHGDSTANYTYRVCDSKDTDVQSQYFTYNSSVFDSSRTWTKVRIRPVTPDLKPGNYTVYLRINGGLNFGDITYVKVPVKVIKQDVSYSLKATQKMNLYDEAPTATIAITCKKPIENPESDVTFTQVVENSFNITYAGNENNGKNVYYYSVTPKELGLKANGRSLTNSNSAKVRVAVVGHDAKARMVTIPVVYKAPKSVKPADPSLTVPGTVVVNEISYGGAVFNVKKNSYPTVDGQVYDTYVLDGDMVDNFELTTVPDNPNQLCVKIKPSNIENLKVGRTYKFRITNVGTVGGEEVYRVTSKAVTLKIVKSPYALKEVERGVIYSYRSAYKAKTKISLLNTYGLRGNQKISGGLDVDKDGNDDIVVGQNLRFDSATGKNTTYTTYVKFVDNDGTCEAVKPGTYTVPVEIIVNDGTVIKRKLKVTVK